MIMIMLCSICVILSFIVLNLLLLCFRRRALQRKVQESQIPAEEQEVMMRNLERKETEYMRLQRRKIGIDDFEQLTVIGKGAFGEVGEHIKQWISVNFTLQVFISFYAYKLLAFVKM